MKEMMITVNRVHQLNDNNFQIIIEQSQLKIAIIYIQFIFNWNTYANAIQLTKCTRDDTYDFSLHVRVNDDVLAFFFL